MTCRISGSDFRVGGRIFATLASAKQGYGNLMLTLEPSLLEINTDAITR